ncbi:MAG TPA: hypothetical protein VG498_11790 [Terriglobales bacterium]|nr:hypothetical protein [Terriglobales bacterium]
MLSGIMGSSGQQFPIRQGIHPKYGRPMGRKVSPENLLPFEPDEATPLDLYTPTHGNILAMMAESGSHSEDEEAPMQSQAIEDDHAVAATIPVEHSVVDESGHMDHHRKPIISIHGKDVDEHELDHKDAA